MAGTDAALARHNLSAAEYDSLAEAQGGRCAVCLRSDVRLVIDHDHECCGPVMLTGRPTCGFCVRGLLCHRCNMLLGFLEGTSADVVVRALQYISGKNPRAVGSPFRIADLAALVEYLSIESVAAIA